MGRAGPQIRRKYPKNRLLSPGDAMSQAPLSINRRIGLFSGKTGRDRGKIRTGKENSRIFYNLKELMSIP
jgi:hypothetical protein